MRRPGPRTTLSSALLLLALPSCNGDRDPVRPVPLTSDGVCVEPDGPLDAPAGGFTDVTEEAGLVTDVVAFWPMREPFLGRPATSAAAAGDVDGDDDVDLFVFGYAGGGGLYRNDGRGRFARDDDTGVPAQPVAAASFCDVDGDGDVDLLLSPFPDPDRPDGAHLYYNDGHGRFTDVTARVGFGRRAGIVSAFACGDYDGDRRTDVYLARGQLNYVHDPRNELLRQRMDGTFEDVAPALGLDSPGWTHAAMFSDADGDGDLDVVVADDNFLSMVFAGAPSQTGFYYNDDGGRGAPFRRVSPFGANVIGDMMGIAAADFDGDARLDYFFTDIGVQHLVRNRAGGLEDVAEDVGVYFNRQENYVAWGTRFHDFDLDGWPDLTVVCGPLHILPESKVPEMGPFQNRPCPIFLFRNAGGRFEDVAARHGFGAPQTGRGIVATDVDLDGNLDLVVGRRGAGVVLYRNDIENAGHFLKLRLRGTASARPAVGARVTIAAGGRTQTIELTNQANVLAGDDLVVHAGVGSARSADRVDIRWPSGRTQTFRCVAADAYYDVTEPN